MHKIDVKLTNRKSIYIALFGQDTLKALRHGCMDHTFLPANNTMLFLRERSPDVTTTETEAADIQLQLTTHLSTPKG